MNQSQLNDGNNPVIASLSSFGYRRHCLRRTFSLVCNRLNRITPCEARPKRVIRGQQLTFRLHDYNECFFYFGTAVEPENTALIGAIGSESNGGDFIDVGANYGQISSDLVGKFRSMVLLEPNPEAASFLRTLFAVERSVRIVEAGAGDKAQPGVFCIAEEDQSGGSRISTNVNDIGPKITVTTVDDVVEQSGITPVVIKIDVEGFEEHVLRGAARTIEVHHPILAWEVRNKEHFEACRQFIPNWDFYRADSALVHGLKGIRRVIIFARAVIGGSKTYISKVNKVTGFVSLIFAVHRDKQELITKAIGRLARQGVQF